MFLLRQWAMPAFMLAAIFLFAGCASGPPPKPRIEVTVESYSTEFDEVWNAVNDVLTEKRFPIKVIEKESGVVTTEFVGAGSSYIFTGLKDDAGSDLSTWANKIRYFLSIRVRQGSSGKTVVDVIPHVEYMRYQDQYELGWAACRSHGDIEQDFYSALNTKLKK